MTASRRLAYAGAIGSASPLLPVVVSEEGGVWFARRGADFVASESREALDDLIWRWLR